MEVTILGIIVSSTGEKNKILIVCTFITPTYTFSSAGNIIDYTPGQGTKREKSFTNHNIKVKMSTLAGKKQLFHPSFPS